MEKLRKRVLLLLLTFSEFISMPTPTINSLSPASYTEQGGAITLDSDINFSGGADYRNGYLEFSVSGATASETLTLATDGSSSITSGELSIVGTQVFLGNGSEAVFIGSVDSTFNGQNGQKLRVNFTTTFANGDFNDGSPGDTTISSWTVMNQPVKFGTDTIAGLPTPVDATIQPKAPNSDQNTPFALYSITTDLSSDTPDGSGNSVRLYSEMDTQAGYDIVRGPYIYSDSTVTLAAGDQASFDWKAQGGGDDYDVYGYIIDVNTGHIETILDATGRSTAWAKETITVSQAGEYRFVFVAGTYDLTGGKYAGAQLFIDNVEATTARPPTIVDDSHLSAIAQRVQYDNTSKTPELSKVLTVSVQNTDGENSSDTTNINIISNNNAPIFTKGGDQSVSEDAGAQSVAGWATDILPGATDETAQILSFKVTNDNDSLFSVQPGIDEFGNLTYTPAVNANGSAKITVSLSDDGGTANGGVDTSVAQTFTITVSPVNDAPLFTVGADQSVAEDAGAQSVANWATNVSPGAANETDQSLSFKVTSDNDSLFSVPTWY